VLIRGIFEAQPLAPGYPERLAAVVLRSIGYAPPVSDTRPGTPAQEGQ
jgi:hypothetical protein